MNVSTAVLARYDLAHRYVIAPGATGLLRERYLQLGGVKDPAQVDAICQQLLELVRVPLRTIAVQGAALGAGQLPQRDLALGDSIDGDLVVGYNIDGTAEGVAIITPELVTHQQLGIDALDRTLKRMAAGGSSASANPATQSSPSGSGTDTTPPPFTLDPTVTATMSPAWKVPRPFHVTWMTAVLGTAGTSATVVRLVRGAFAVGDVLTLGAGSTEATVVIDTPFTAGDQLRMIVETAGAGAQKLTVTPIGAML